MLIKNKKVVVFGGSGFLGSNVADALSEVGANVVIFDLKKSPYIQNGQKMVVGDIINKKDVINVVKGASFVYNFAGVSNLKESLKQPFDTMYFNVLGNINILNACVKNKVNRFVFASSLYVYSNGGSFYRISKLSSELIIEQFQEKFGLEYTIMRYGSLYGPRSDLRNGIYRFIHQAVTEGKIEYHGTEDDIRDYIHVHDASRLSIKILDKSYKNKCITISGQQTLSAKSVLSMINEILNKKIKIKIYPPKEFINYSITPYNFTPRQGIRLIDKSFVDMGEGVLRIVEEIYHKHELSKNEKKSHKKY